MTRRHHDQFAKQCLSGFLSPFGESEISLEIPSEVQQVDVWFIPNAARSQARSTLGLLGQIAATPCLLEAFRNRVQPDHLLDCQSKLNAVRHELGRQAKSQKRRLLKQEQPWLWVFSPAVSQSVLESFAAKERATWSQGVYFFPTGQRIGLIAVNQLPVTPETLWIRLFGRDSVQEGAIVELLALPINHPFRAHALEQLANLRVTIQARQNLDRDERGLIMALSPAYERWQTETLQQGERIGERRGKLETVFRQLTRKVGSLSPEMRSSIETLPLPLLEELSEALLDFASVDDIEDWLTTHSSES